MNVVQALVEKSTSPNLDLDDLLKTYRLYYPRKPEAKRLLREAAIASIDIRDLYAEPLAWNRETRLPEVALAPIKGPLRPSRFAAVTDSIPTQ